MKRTFATLLGFAIAFFLLQPGTAWGQQFRPLGGIIFGNPSCASTVSGVVICGVKGSDNALYGIRFNPRTGASSGFRRVESVIVGNPSCGVTVSEDLICGVIGTNNDLFGIRFDPTTGVVVGFLPLGGVIVSDPSCGVTGSEDMICGVIGTNNDLFSIQFNPVTGVNPATGVSALFVPLGGPLRRLGGPLGGGIVGNPSCVVEPFGRGGPAFQTCAVRAADNHLYAIEFVPSTGDRGGFDDRGGPIFDDPSCWSRSETNAVFCGVRGTGNHLFGVATSGSETAAQLQDLGIVIVGKPSCASPVEFDVDAACGVKGTDNALNIIKFINVNAKFGLPSKFERLGGIIADDPSCITLGKFSASVNVICGVKGLENALFITKVIFTPSIGP